MLSPTFVTADLVKALGFERRELIAIVGGGGKSSLLFALGDELPGRVVLTTTTRIFAAQMKAAREVFALSGDASDEGWKRAVDAFESSLLIVGGVEGDRAKGVAPDLPAQMFARSRVDWVVVEADGSRMRPVKAPADHEPVIPTGCSVVVGVVGIDALAGPIRDVAHRPERLCEITGQRPDDALTPETLAAVITSRNGGLKDVPAGARALALINKVETGAQLEAARLVARTVVREPRIERVLIGALRGAPPTAGRRTPDRLESPGASRSWEVHSARPRSVGS